MQNVPTIQGQRTLIIGLGSTGTRVCNQILDRMLWMYQSPENIPWVKFLVIETAQIPTDTVVSQHAHIKLHIKIEPEEFSYLVENPNSFKETINLPAIQIPSLLQDVSGILDGAGNVRFLGRLGFLYPSNFMKIRNAVHELVGQLHNVSIPGASASFTQGVGSETTVNLDGAVHVYVVGSLCGGTASGCFIDLGYMLQEYDFDLFENSTGIFLLPSNQETDRLLVANAVAGLQELNHFSDRRNLYTVQFPHMRQTPFQAKRGTAPYRYTYLAQASNSHISDYPRLVTSTADYLFCDLIGPLGGAKLAERVNMQMFMPQPDLSGRTQKFMTFGQSVIEFPHTKVLKACALKLAGAAFNNLARQHDDMVENQCVQRALAQTPLLMQHNLANRLLRMPDGQSIKHLVNRQIEGRRSLAEKSVDVLDLLQQQIDIAFDGGDVGIALPDMPPRMVQHTIERNALAARDELVDSITDAMRGLLAGEDACGLPGVIAYLKAVKQQMASPAAAIAPQEVITELRAALVDKRAALDKSLNAGCLWTRKKKVKIATRYCIVSLTELYEQRSQFQAQRQIDEIYQFINTWVARFLQRLTGIPCGMQHELTGIIDAYQRMYDQTDTMATDNRGWSRVVNGEELFASGDVEREYDYCLRHSEGKLGIASTDRDVIERALFPQVLTQYLDAAMRELTCDPMQYGRYDAEEGKDPTPFSDDELLQWALLVRPVFEQSINKRSILDRLNSQGASIDTKLKGAFASCAPFLEAHEVHQSYDHHAQKMYGFIAYDTHDPSASDLKKALTNAGVYANWSGKPIANVHIPNRHQIFFIKERGAFSIGLMEQLEVNNKNSKWRNMFMTMSQLGDLRSRGDIGKHDWVSWDEGDQRRRNDAIVHFLIAVALDVAQWESVRAYRFNYPPRQAVDRGTIVFSNNLDEVAKELRDETLFGELKRQIDAKRRSITPTEAVAAIDALIKDDNRVFEEGGERYDSKTSNQLLQVRLGEYMDTDSELKDIWYSDAFYPDRTVQSYFHDEAYYCPNCKGKLGTRVEDLYDIDERGKGVRRCYFCQKII